MFKAGKELLSTGVFTINDSQLFLWTWIKEYDDYDIIWNKYIKNIIIIIIYKIEIGGHYDRYNRYTG